MSRLARDGYDLVIGVGFAQGDAIGKVAQKFPTRGSRSSTSTRHSSPASPPNVQGLLFREQEVGYLVGYLAGLEEKRRAGQDVISAVGGMKEPPVDRFIAGYFAGAEKADPGIKTMLDYSQDWDDQAKCKELALNQIARGSNVVFQVAGGCGLGALERGRRAQALGHRRRRRPVVPRAAHPHERSEGRRRGRLPDDQGGAGRRAGRAAATRPSASRRTASGSATVSPKVPQADLDKVEAIEQEIAAGKITGIPTTVGKS